MSTIYFDNAATSWPKPDVVQVAIGHYFGLAGGNPGRSGHRMSIAASQVVEDARDALADLFNVADPAQIVFAKNATEALNLAIYGWLQPGDHAITTSLEHNSVMRPLRHLESKGLELTVINCAADGTLDVEAVRQAFKSNTKLLVTTHGSNVVGTVMPIKQLAEIAHEHDVPYLIDAAQTAGVLPIDVEALGIDILTFTGHKGLYGLTGTGGLYIREGLTLKPLMRGGTGSDSAYEYQPTFLPDIYESGTPNVAGLTGLAAGVNFLLETGIEQVAAHERRLMTRFLDGTRNIRGVTVYGPDDVGIRCGVVSFNIDGLVPSEVALLLDREYSIMCRPGLHCAPRAHHSLGTFPTGTVRFSFGYFNTLAEIDTAVNALRELITVAEQQKVSS
ncbi:MAG: aminotransferase class V-fold PLP-dependent enzyme [Chloroflexi bacterium]|nr:MAG: cysteine desulfurase [Phototrophicales bacterium]RMF82713.1 MAG: aminotransferase class V-fold PLP-dependent enzyme [Chloroflexota bacterium]